MPLGNAFQGQVASTVFVNTKCEGCLHFERQAGLSGLCEVGLQPATCGDGRYPRMGYSPIAGQEATLPPNTMPAVPAVGPVGQLDGLGHQPTDPSTLEVLGDEGRLRGVFKKAFDAAVARVQDDCQVHQQGHVGAQHSPFSSDAYARCNCGVVKAEDVERDFISRFPRRARLFGMPQLAAYAQKAFAEAYVLPVSAAGVLEKAQADQENRVDLGSYDCLEDAYAAIRAHAKKGGVDADDVRKAWHAVQNPLASEGMHTAAMETEHGTYTVHYGGKKQKGAAHAFYVPKGSSGPSDPREVASRHPTHLHAMQAAEGHHAMVAGHHGYGSVKKAETRLGESVVVDACGTTRSGKAIPKLEKPKGGDLWTAQDHVDAAEAHRERHLRASRKASEAAAMGQSSRRRRHEGKSEAHGDLWKWHAEEARKGSTIVKAAKPFTPPHAHEAKWSGVRSGQMGRDEAHGSYAITAGMKGVKLHYDSASGVHEHIEHAGGVKNAMRAAEKHHQQHLSATGQR